MPSVYVLINLNLIIIRISVLSILKLPYYLIKSTGNCILILFPKSSLIFSTYFFPLKQSFSLNQILLNFYLGLEIDIKQEVIFERSFKIITSPIHTSVTNTFHEVIFSTLNFILSISIFVTNGATSHLILFNLMSYYFSGILEANEEKIINHIYSNPNSLRPKLKDKKKLIGKDRRDWRRLCLYNGNSFRGKYLSYFYIWEL